MTAQKIPGDRLVLASIGKTPLSSLRSADGSRECAPDDGLRD